MPPKVSTKYPAQVQKSGIGVIGCVCGFLVVPLAVFMALFLAGVFLPGYEPPPMPEDQWWLSGKPGKDHPDVKPFTVSVPDQVLVDLKARLSRPRPSVRPLQGAAFTYGINSDFLYSRVIPYWRDTYNWRAQEKTLNSLPQYTTQIEGLQIHFLNVPAKVRPDPPNQKSVKTIMLVHGWPGGVLEFYKAIPMLTDPVAHGGKPEDAVNVIAPSIPGYYYSQAPEIQGFDAVDAARIFAKLMSKLGVDKYYVQGGDWGSAIATLLAQFYPDNVLGVHVNLLVPPNKNIDYTIRLGLGGISPALIGLDDRDAARVFPFIARTLDILEEVGYFTLQATKPDTIGTALQDTPVGLAAYILEKFSTWTNTTYRNLDDGGLLKHWTLDELLTSVMAYWVSGCITSSQRFYKENIHGLHAFQNEFRVKDVPAGYAAFPDDLVTIPCSWAKLYKFELLVHCTAPEEGGHFAAFQVPHLFVKDVRQFVQKVEESRLFFAGHFSEGRA